MDHEKLLEKAGLTRNEAIVYLTLLKIGKSKSGDIIREAKIAGGKIYETLYKLVDKGLVESIIEDGVKQFSAAEPESIYEYIEDKRREITSQEEEFKKIMPELKKIKHFQVPTENVYMIKGFKGIKPVVYDALDKVKGESKIMGIRSTKAEKYNIFWQHWHAERAKQKKKARVICTDRNTPFWNSFKSITHTKIRCLSHLSPAAFLIMDNNTFIFSYDKDFTCIHIVSESVAMSFNSFFESMWVIAKE